MLLKPLGHLSAGVVNLSILAKTKKPCIGAEELEFFIPREIRAEKRFSAEWDLRVGEYQVN